MKTIGALGRLAITPPGAALGRSRPYTTCLSDYCRDPRQFRHLSLGVPHKKIRARQQSLFA